MKDRKLKIIFLIVSILLLICLLIKLIAVPDGLILSGLFLGGIFIVGILIACVFMALILRSFIKKYSFLTLYLILTSLSFIAFHYRLYSPTLKLIVPDGYVGEVNLVQSNVDENILILDSNGIGYLNKWTFSKLFSRPEVYTTSGKNINNLCVGFNPSTFFGVSKFCCVDAKVIRSKSFNIVTDSVQQVKSFYSKGFSQFVDSKKLYDNK